ncbi:MAG: hypothetical protein V1824_01170 [archaeon]
MVFDKLKNIFRKKESSSDEKNKIENIQKSKPMAIDFANSKYPSETCSLCSQKGCDKKFAGQYWHKKCLRSTKSIAKGMI